MQTKPAGKRQCNIIIDSCCDLPKHLIDALDVTLLEFPFVIDDEEFSDDVWETMEPKEFYDRMRKGSSPHTMQVPVPVLTEAFIQAYESKVPTVYISFTSGLSGGYFTATRIAKELAEQYPEGELYVVDSQLASIAEGVLVIEACRQRDRGLSAAALAAWVEEARYYVHGIFTLDTLDALRRGGRIPALGAYAGAVLNIKPILSFDLEGNLAMMQMTRGRKKALKQLNIMFDDLALEPNQMPIVVATADAEKDGDTVAEGIHKIAPKAVIVRSSIGPVIGSHVGPGMVAAAFFGPDRRASINLSDRIANRVSQGDAAATGSVNQLSGFEN